MSVNTTSYTGDEPEYDANITRSRNPDTFPEIVPYIWIGDPPAFTGCCQIDTAPISSPEFRVTLHVCKLTLLTGDASESESATWQWQYNTSVCFNDGENATLTWRVTLNSGEGVGAVSIWQQPVKAGGSPIQMYSTISGKVSGFRDRVMSLSYSGSSPVYDVVFTLKVNNSADGFGTKQIQCRVNSKNYLIGQPASDTVLKVQEDPHKPDNTSLTILGGNASAQCGLKISFNCTADGVPKPNKYSLYLGNQAMKTDTNGEFSNIQLNTSGEHVFTCVPTNIIGEGLNKTVIVNASEVLPVVSVDIPSNSRMIKGSNVTLTCDGTGPVPLQISWYKDNIFKASGKNLTISKVTVQDEGNYTCNVSSSCGTTLNTSFIGVDYIPENTTLQINKSNNTSITACVGDIILLNCYAEGKPSVITYSLLLNGEQHKANRSGVFLVFPGTPGWNNFSCVPNNTIGKGPEALVHIIVPDKPVNTSLTILGGDASRQCGSNVSFNCTADGVPKPNKYSLYLGNQTIKTNTNGVLSNIKLNTSGEHVFTCVPTNEIGEGLNKTVIVNASEVLPVVSVDIPPNGRMVKGSSVTLTCDGTGPVPLQISWYKDNIFIGLGKTLTISKVTVQDEGNYTCNVSSSCGTTLNTSFIIVDYLYPNKEQWFLQWGGLFLSDGYSKYKPNNGLCFIWPPYILNLCRVLTYLAFQERWSLY
ncbi:predicted protein [Nematostella vectensis]|uniref:Ig-like domain-containing protein n=1 Tax=Nematostella vectensis TaxID=45351 RepID=A7RTK8_NEMVE|nr:predicted protein [Nematostella vectensis]|eukprot:XP_001637291.1 predicted protein [Nematostella vectensis]